MSALALFDLDKTLIPQDSDYNWGVFLGKYGYVDVNEYRARNEFFHGQYLAGTLDIIAYSEFVFKVLTDNPMERLLQWREQFAQEFLPKVITPSALDLVKRHRAAGHTCVMISATNEFVITPIGLALGFEDGHIIGTKPEMRNDAFTGKVAGEPSFKAGKITRIEQWLAERGQAWADFSTQFFYSDSFNDLPLLERVNFPMVCHPDAHLREIAQQRHWAVLNLFDVQH